MLKMILKRRMEKNNYGEDIEEGYMTKFTNLDNNTTKSKELRELIR